MAAELVGTAYVRIRAITTGLAKDISDGVDKGVKDAGPDVQKSGEDLGDDLGEGTSKGFGKSFKGTVSDGVADEVDSPDIHRTAEKGGSSIAKDVRSGIEDENKRKNPFASLLQSFKNIRRDKDNFDLDVDFGIPDIDLPNLFKGLGDDAEEGGEGIGDRVTDGIEKSHKKRNPFASLGESLANIDLPAPIKWAGIFGPTTLAPIIGTILAGLALVSEALGFIVLAAAGAGVALAGIAAVAMPGLAVLFAAFKADTPIMKKFKEEVKDLLKPWKEVAEETQRRMIPGLREAARTLMGNDGLVALFKDFGGNIGQIVGDMAHYASAVLTSSKNMDALATILSASSDFFVNIRDAAVSFIDALLPFLAAAAPLAVQFSEALAGWAAHFQEFINRSSETGELTATFQGWYDKLTVVVDILGNVFSLLWSVLSIAGETGTPFFDRIAEATQGWSDWAKSTDGQNRIKQFFLDAQPVIDEIFRLIGNVWDLIVQPATSDGGATMFSNLAGALDMLNDVLENPVTATVVPYLLGLATALGLLSLVPAPLLTGLGGAVDILARALGNLATTIGGLLIKALAELSIALLTTPAGWVLLAIAAAALAVYLAFQHWDEVTAALQSAWEWFTKLSTPLKIAVGLLGVFAIMVVPLVAPILAFAAAVLAVTWALKNWETVLGVVTAVKDAIVGFVTGLPAMISALPGQLLSVGTAIVNFFKELPSTIGDALSGLGEILRVALLDAVRNAPTWLLDGLDALYQAGQELLGAIADGLAFALPELAQFFVELPITILKAIGAIASTLLPIGLKIIGFILTGLVQAGPRILAWFIALPFEIATLMAKAGAALMTALAKGILDNKDRVFQFFLDLPANLLSMVITAATWLLQVGSDIIQGIWQGI